MVYVVEEKIRFRPSLYMLSSYIAYKYHRSWITFVSNKLESWLFWTKLIHLPKDIQYMMDIIITILSSIPRETEKYNRQNSAPNESFRKWEDINTLWSYGAFKHRRWRPCVRMTLISPLQKQQESNASYSTAVQIYMEFRHRLLCTDSMLSSVQSF